MPGPYHGSPNCFLHLTKVARGDQHLLAPGVAIEFTPVETAKGRAAVSAQIIRDAKGLEVLAQSIGIDNW